MRRADNRLGEEDASLTVQASGNAFGRRLQSRDSTSPLTLRLAIVTSLAILVLLFVAANILFADEQNQPARLRSVSALRKSPASLSKVQVLNITLSQLSDLPPDERAAILTDLRSGTQ